MKTLPFILAADKTLTLILKGKQHIVHSTHPNHAEILKSLNDEEKMTSLLNSLPEKIMDEDFEVCHGIVTFKGEELHGVIIDRVIQLEALNLPYDGLVKFLANCKRNPRPQAVEELYLFLEHGGFPILPDGCFLGYKKVRDNFLDVHSGTMDNSVGKTVTMPRDAVDDDPNSACSHGLHVGTLEYVRGFGGQVIILVKVNPEDVVSVPHDYHHQKLRACKYEVISVYKDEEKINTPYAREQDFNPSYGETAEQYEARKTREYDQIIADIKTKFAIDDLVAVLVETSLLTSEELAKGYTFEELLSFFEKSLREGDPAWSLLKPSTCLRMAAFLELEVGDWDNEAEILSALTNSWDDQDIDLEIDIYDYVDYPEDEECSDPDDDADYYEDDDSDDDYGY